MVPITKRSSQVADLFARLLNRPNGGTAPRRGSGRDSGGRNPQTRTGLSDSSATIIGSPENLQEKIAAYQIRGWGLQSTGQSARKSEPTLMFGGQEPNNGCPPTLNMRSPRSMWADKWQR